MSFLEWDCEQEQKDKYAAHVRKCAEDIKACNITIAWSKLNNLWCFLSGCGYSEATINTLKDSADYFCKQSDKENLVSCIQDFAASITIMALPKKPTAPQISINNANSQTTNIRVIEEAISNELSSAQIDELKSLLMKNKRGDVKEWFSNLGNNTLSGIPSTLITNIPDFSNFL